MYNCISYKVDPSLNCPVQWEMCLIVFDTSKYYTFQWSTVQQNLWISEPLLVEVFFQEDYTKDIFFQSLHQMQLKQLKLQMVKVQMIMQVSVDDGDVPMI